MLVFLLKSWFFLYSFRKYWTILVQQYLTQNCGLKDNSVQVIYFKIWIFTVKRNFDSIIFIVKCTTDWLPQILKCTNRFVCESMSVGLVTFTNKYIWNDTFYRNSFVYYRPAGSFTTPLPLDLSWLAPMIMAFGRSS